MSHAESAGDHLVVERMSLNVLDREQLVNLLAVVVCCFPKRLVGLASIA